MQLKIGDRVRGKYLYGWEDEVGTVVEVTEPMGLVDDGMVRVAWDCDQSRAWPGGRPEVCYSYQSMVELLPGDFGSGVQGM